ncbi:hypothetical protein N7478_000990 [Penicillium angulare]|uniref:uncharacterized protein n=1 Tax=Penicillium angulare TaxID=116970 RepID=UPI0025401ACE|nr:uncharacterized protein N7478_000990 [Penicillium angulare]KAJ5291739.1 hypothetical protein N7478_000990 [Penicillium angulare]
MADSERVQLVIDECEWQNPSNLLFQDRLGKMGREGGKGKREEEEGDVFVGGGYDVCGGATAAAVRALLDARGDAQLE